MGLKIEIVKDTATPSLKKYAEADGDFKEILIASVALELQRWTVESFSDKSKRESPWINKKDGTPSSLTGKPNLRPSIRVDPADFSVFTTVKYAAVHQFGYAKRNIPRRPYFPFTKSGNLFAPFSRRIDALVEKSKYLS